MSSYGPPPTPASLTPSVPTRPAVASWRLVVVILATVLGAPAALVTAFFAAVTWSGCFLDCSDPNRSGGALLWLLAVALLLAGPVLAGVLLRRGVAVAWAVAGVVVVPALMLLRFVGF